MYLSYVLDTCKPHSGSDNLALINKEGTKITSGVRYPTFNWLMTLVM